MNEKQIKQLVDRLYESHKDLYQKQKDTLNNMSVDDLEYITEKQMTSYIKGQMVILETLREAIK